MTQGDYIIRDPGDPDFREIEVRAWDAEDALEKSKLQGYRITYIDNWPGRASKIDVTRDD